MMTKEIIGSEPPIAEIKNIFEKELENLLQKLESIPIDDLEDLLEQQKICKKHINTRPGAMALDQPKIQMFNVYNDKYLEKINEKFTQF